MPISICYLLFAVFFHFFTNLYKIYAFQIIKDHPEWWVVLSLNGYGSHRNVLSAMQCFHDHRIHVVKEEGDASDTNQAHDQSVAKADKTQI